MALEGNIGRVAQGVREYFARGGKAAIDVAQRKAWTYEDLGLAGPDDRQAWPWDDVESPIAFARRGELLGVVEATEREYDWGAACAAGRAAHRKLLDAGDWMLRHPRQHLVRVTKLGTAVDELGEHGVEFFHPWLAWYGVAALTREDGDLAVKVVRVQRRDWAVTRAVVRDFGRGYSTPLMRGRVEHEVAQIVLGDGDDDAAVIAERMATVRREVGILSRLVRACYQQAVGALDDQLLADAADRDDARRQRLLNAPFVTALNGQRPHRSRRPRWVLLDADGVRLVSANSPRRLRQQP